MNGIKRIADACDEAGVKIEFQQPYEHKKRQLLSDLRVVAIPQNHNDTSDRHTVAFTRAYILLRVIQTVLFHAHTLNIPKHHISVVVRQLPEHTQQFLLDIAYQRRGGALG